MFSRFMSDGLEAPLAVERQGVEGAGGMLDGVEIPTWKLGLECLGGPALAEASSNEGEVPKLWMAAF